MARRRTRFSTSRLNCARDRLAVVAGRLIGRERGSASREQGSLPSCYRDRWLGNQLRANRLSSFKDRGTCQCQSREEGGTVDFRRPHDALLPPSSRTTQDQQLAALRVEDPILADTKEEILLAFLHIVAVLRTGGNHFHDDFWD